MGLSLVCPSFFASPARIPLVRIRLIQLHRVAVVGRLNLRLRRHLSNEATSVKDNLKPLCLCRCHRRRHRRRSPVLVRLEVV